MQIIVSYLTILENETEFKESGVTLEGVRGLRPHPLNFAKG